jgi:hypothetical protein
MTLNHRVPGSSPGAPTKLFNSLSQIAKLRKIPCPRCVRINIVGQPLLSLASPMKRPAP